MLVPLALAVSMPPHARVNYRCWPVWNAEKTDLKVIWNEREYTQPWSFDKEVNYGEQTCQADACV